jgi:DNA replication protein DnaC
MTTLQEKLAKHRQLTSPEELELARREYIRSVAVCDPECPLCGGSGMIQDAPLPGEPVGRWRECPNYYSKRLRANAEVYGMAASEIELMDWQLVEDIGCAWKAMAQVRATLEAGYGWVFLWGDHGQAKTLLLKIAVAVTLRSGRLAAYTNMVGILDNLKRAFDAGPGEDPGAESKIEWWQKIPLLAIDEFNRVKESEWANERRFALMDMRYVQAVRHETVTLIASNTPPDQQDSYLRDRILDGRFEVIELKGPSVRRSIKDKDFIF